MARKQIQEMGPCKVCEGQMVGLGNGPCDVGVQVVGGAVFDQIAEEAQQLRHLGSMNLARTRKIPLGGSTPQTPRISLGDSPNQWLL